jgi:hypothetical protein
MNFLQRAVIAFALITATNLPANADLVISGESLIFDASGEYTVNLFATAEGQAEQVGGFGISLDFSSPNLTVERVAYNAAFETFLPVLAGDNPAQLSGTDTGFQPLSIGLNETVSLATVTFTATAPASAPISVLEITDGFFQNIAFRLDPQASALSVVAIPEPTSMALLASLGVIAGVTRRRRRRV